jgi:hypothetical protein
MSPIPVVLLKSSSRSCSTSTPDPYAHLLSQPASTSRAPSYSPAFLEVFETTLIDDGALESVLLAGSQRWRGVVVSRRLAGEQLGAAHGSHTAGKGKGRAVEEDQQGDDGCACGVAPSPVRGGRC